jgi:hypothetical protein
MYGKKAIIKLLKNCIVSIFQKISRGDRMNDIGVTNKRVTAKLPDKPVTSHPGLEKIEPLVGSNDWLFFI